MPQSHERIGVAGHTGKSHTIPSIGRVGRVVCMVPDLRIGPDPRGHTQPRIVPKGTAGAVPLPVAIRILRERLGMPEHSEETRERLAVTTRRSWKRGAYNENTIMRRLHAGR